MEIVNRLSFIFRLDMNFYPLSRPDTTPGTLIGGNIAPIWSPTQETLLDSMVARVSGKGIYLM